MASPDPAADDWTALRDAVNELINPTTRSEIGTEWVGGHRKAKVEQVPVPSLLDQLRDLAGWPYQSAMQNDALRHAKRVRDEPQVDPRARAADAELAWLREQVAGWLQPFKWLRRQPLERQLTALVLICRQYAAGDTPAVARDARSWLERVRRAVTWREVG